MATTLHIGKKRVQTIAASDGSTIPAGAVTASVLPSGIVSVSVDPVTNNVTVTGVTANTANVTYSAAGYNSVSETFQVAPLPTLVVTDGIEQ